MPNRGALALCASTAALLLACAEERPTIDRVQPDALEKSFFVGEELQDPTDDPEFWTQATLIDVPYGVSQSYLFTSTFSQGVARIKFQITEDYLLGRLTYERIDDSDGKGVGPASSDGQIVVAYRIKSHFDIVYAYNPTTGERLNIKEENTRDRPWYEREYFRVDWSENVAGKAYDFDTLSLMGVYGAVTYSPLAYYVNDPNDPDAPYFDVENGYFDVTNKSFVEPQDIDLSSLGWGIAGFPACYLPDEFSGGSWPKGNCNPSEITIRQAFRRVVDSDFEPMDWDGYRFQGYGAFTKERYGYARNYGMSDAKWHRFLTRYNIWERSHYYTDPDSMLGAVPCFTPETTPVGADPHRDDDGDGTEDECQAVTDATGVGGSRCDTFKQRCTLPIRLRTPKPLAWYYTSGSHPDYFDGSAWATHDWDVAFRHAVQVARYSECRSTGGSKAECSPGDDDPAPPDPMDAVYFGQMDDHLEAKQLARDVDDCRAGRVAGHGPDEASCLALAEDLGQKRGLARGVIELAKMPELIVLCHSPVEAGDPAACAPPEERLPSDMCAEDCAQAQKNRNLDVMETCKEARFVRRGDLRYHLINVIAEPQTPSPWGIYADAEDPLTGETFSASVNIWAHVNDLWSQAVVDRVRYVKGELATEDVTEAEHVRNWVQATQAAQDPGSASRIDRHGLQRRAASMAGMPVDKFRDLVATGKPTFDPEVLKLSQRVYQELQGVRASAKVPSALAAKYEARRARVAGSLVEAELIDPMMLEYAGVSELPSAAGDVTTLASPLQGANPGLAKQLRHMRELALAERGACVMHQAPAPVAVTGLADVLEKKFEKEYGKFSADDPEDKQLERAEAIRRFLAQRAHMAVIVHEMGHSIGQRHNFVSSADAWGYRPQYWQLRTRNGQVTRRCGCDGSAGPEQSCLDYEPNGAECLGPRYYDPMSQEESDNLIWMWMQSSVMDYAGEYIQDMLGLAAWDYASARMFYGDAVAVFDDESYRVTYSPGADASVRSTGMLSKMDNFGGIIGMPTTIGRAPDGGDTRETRDVHYSELNNYYDLIQDCRTVDPQDFKPLVWDESTLGEWDPLLDGLIVSVDGSYSKCRQQRVDYVPWNTLRQPEPGQDHPASMWYAGGPSVDPEGRVRVPYGFATDSWADLGNASVYRHDNGADIFEISDFLIKQQEIQHVFDNYRRGRADFSVRKQADRILGRFNEKIRDAAKGLGLYANIYRVFWMNLGYDFDTLWPQMTYYWFPDNIMAAGMTFDHFVRTMSRPESGGHYVDAEGIYRAVADEFAGEADEDDPYTWDLVVPNGGAGYPGAAGGGPFGNIGFGGKLVENRLCDNCGEYDTDYTMNAGSYYDKVNAPYLMAESVDNFISDSRLDFVDSRYRSVSLADLFPEGYRRWLGSALTGDDLLKGPHVAAWADEDENPVSSQACDRVETGSTCNTCCAVQGAMSSAYDADGGCTCFGGPMVEEVGELVEWPTDRAFDEPAYGVRGERHLTWPLGWVTLWTEEPEVCFPNADTQVCAVYGKPAGDVSWHPPDFDPRTPPKTLVLDPQIGWDQQKFLINWTMLYLPENEQQKWINYLRVWELGIEADPGFENRIEFHDPSGRVYVAKTFGKETWFAGTPYEKTVQRGIAARILEYANELQEKAYFTNPGPDLDNDGEPDWYVPAIYAQTGQPIVKSDPEISSSCEGNTCSCSSNRFCIQLQSYLTVPFYLRQALGAYGLAPPAQDGLFDF